MTPVLLALTVVTAANYVWQVPYAIHQYGSSWIRLPRLSVLLILTLVWFVAGMVLYVRGHRSGPVVLGSFFLVEAAFYVLHNLSGAFGHDVPLSNPVLLVASVLGYLNMVAAVAALWYLVAHRRSGALPRRA